MLKSKGFTLIRTLRRKNLIRVQLGFTLIELLVVIVILGILATIGLVAFTTAQARGRDSKRKSDLKQIATALELYYSDYGVYPGSNAGKIVGCPSGTPGTDCEWGMMDSPSSIFRDGKTTYMRIIPGDSSGGYSYYYGAMTVDSVADQGFQLFAHLENTQDPGRISTNYSCGGGANTCNFAITSANVTGIQ